MGPGAILRVARVAPMDTFIEVMKRAFGLRRISPRDDDAIAAIEKLVAEFPRGAELVRIYREFDMGRRTYIVGLPKDSEHYDAGGELDIYALEAEVIARDASLHPNQLLRRHGLIEIGGDAVGTGDMFFISLMNESDFNLYCVYSGEVAPSDARDPSQFLHKVVDLSDPAIKICEPPSEEPPSPKP